jgi:hypothetical protein
MSKKSHAKIGQQKQPEHTPTSEKLAKALEEAGAPAEMIQRARQGAYDDYKSHRADNINALIADAGKHQLPTIVQQAIDGAFDAQPWEAEEWRWSAEGRSALKEFGL